MGVKVEVVGVKGLGGLIARGIVEQDGDLHEGLIGGGLVRGAAESKTGKGKRGEYELEFHG